MKKIFTAALLMAAMFTRLSGQSAAVSQVTGTVQDSAGASVPGAQVTITNADTSATRSMETGPDGSYTFANLAVGPYRLQVTKTGFATYNQVGIVLQVNSNPQVNVTLRIGAVTEQIEVQADAAMLETQSNGIGQVIDQQRVVDLPLNGRNLAQLITLSGAAVNNSQGGLATQLNYPTVTPISIAGGQPNATNFYLDGGTHLDARTNVGLPLPFPDAVQEFKVETSSVPADYGSRPGGTVNVVTKSGTNTVHGDLFYFLRNGALNARNYFAATRDSLKRNQFGGVIGGPVVKDKLFLFGGYQGTIVRTAPATNVAYVPTAAVLQGNFQAMLAPPCQARQVNLLPSTGAVNNVLPASALDPVALKFLALLPVASDPCGKISYGIPNNFKEYQAVTRMDWQRTATDSIFVRYYITDYNLEAYYDKRNILTAVNTGQLDRVQAAILGNTHLINPRTVSSLRVSFVRSAVQDINAEGIPTMQELGSKVTSLVPSYTGQVSATGYFSTAGFPNWVYTNTWALSENVLMSRGPHQINTGVTWVHTQMNADGLFQLNPRMTFNGTLTGNALSDFVTGSLGVMLQGNGQVGRDGQNFPSIYFQDNWKLNRKLQVNLGLRWDPFIPQHTKYGYASQFDPAKFYAGQVSKVYTKAPPGLTFPGDDGYPGTSDTFPRYLNFAPRIGLVFDPRGKGTETIRAAYGMFYDSSFLWLTLHMPLNPPWGNTITLTAPPGKLANPWLGYPGGNPFPTPAIIPSDFPFPVSGVYTFEPLRAHAPYTQQWNFSIQKQINVNWMASATYMGNKITHQWLGYQANPAVYIPGNCAAGQYGLSAPGACSTTANTESRRVLTLANPNTGKYYGSTLITDDNGNGSYNALLLVVQHRFDRNFSILANYTWSHCLNQGESGQDITNMYQNPNDRRSNWGNCISDRRHNLNVSLVAQTPRMASKWAERVLGEWHASGIFSHVSGSPLTITTGTDASLTGANSDRPNIIGEWRVNQDTLNQYFNTAAFSRNAAGTYGNAGRAIISGRANWNLDAALWRTFPTFIEKVKVEARAEAFNILNHSRFGNPGTNLNSGNTFGVTTTALDPRIMQLALKMTF